MTVTPTSAAPVSLGARLGARLLRALFAAAPAFPRELDPSSDGILERTIPIPTRHGFVACTVYSPTDRRDAPIPPVYVNFHGGAFIVRSPRQDEHICRTVVRDVGAVVVNVDYDTAPDVRFPVAEEEAYDVTDWVHQHGSENGWDASRLAVGGFSAGAKLAINVAQQARTSKEFTPAAVIAGYPALDMTIPPDGRESPAPHPAVSPWLLRLMYGSYFVEADSRSTPLASPSLDPDLGTLPPILMLTGSLDALSAEESRFGAAVTAAGGSISHVVYPGVDHGFTHGKPVEIARRAIDLVASTLKDAFANASS